MARKVKRWAVRETAKDGANYLLFVGCEPHTANGRWHPDQVGCVDWQHPRNFEKFYPDCYHLKPGGAVEIRFADEA